MKKASMSVLLLILLVFPVAWARTPAASVVEIASGAADRPLAACRGVHVRRGELILSNALARWLDDRSVDGPGWWAPETLRQLESVRTVVLLRSPVSCRVLLYGGGHGRMPPGETMGGFERLRRWNRRETAFCLEGDIGSCIEAGGHRVLPVPLAADPPLRLYHHGRLELHQGWRPPRAQAVGVDEAVAVRLEGPGDEARFRFTAPGAGTLVVERTPGSLPDLDLLMGLDEENLAPRGSLWLAKGARSLVVFRNRGMEPLKIDAGFLFSPDPFSCTVRVLDSGTERLTLRLLIENQTDEPRIAARPTAGTVRWLRRGRVVAAARPGRAPAKVALGPGERIGYETTLTLSKGDWPDEAVVSRDDRSLRCPVVSRFTRKRIP